MSDSLVKPDNNLAWDGVKKPFFEVYHVQINDTNGHWGFFVDLSLGNPGFGTVHGKSTVAAGFENQDGLVLLEQSYDLSTHDVVHADEFIRIDTSSLSLAECTGGISSAGHTLKWELRFEDPVLTYRPFPEFFYRWNLIPARLLVPRMIGLVSGNIYIDHKKFTLNRERVSQTHIYGPKNPEGRTRVSCLNFLEDSEAFFEAQTCHARVGKRLMGPITTGCIGIEGKLFAFNSLWNMAFGNRATTDQTQWDARFRKNGYEFICRVLGKNNPVKNRFQGPSGELCDSTVFLMADAEIEIRRRHRGLWQDYKQLTAPGKALLQTVLSQADPHHF